MKLSISLFRTTAKDFKDCIREDYPGLQPVEADVELPFAAAGYSVTLKAKEPKWAAYIKKFYNKNHFKNQGHGFLLILKTSERYFGISFGYGFLALNRANLERNFGIKVAANAIGKDKVKAIDSRTIDLVTRQQRVNLSEEASIPDFTIDVDHEWIRLISGKPSDTTFATTLTGSDSLQINTTTGFEDLPAKCDQIFALFNSNDYKDKFPFLDYFTPIKSDDPLKKELDELLNTAVNNRTNEKISIALPEAFLDYPRQDRYKIFCNKAFLETEGLSLSLIYKFLDEHPEIDDPLNKIKIIGLDDQDHPTTKANALYDFFVYETDYNKRIYTITAGDWFLIDNDYAATTRKKLREITDSTSTLALPDMASGEIEGDYNKRLKQVNDSWHLLDCRNVTVEEPHQKVEVCDLLTSDNQFLCIKKMHRSSTLSHLFSQGSVSATLLHDSKKYREDVTAKVSLNNESDLLNPQPTFVFCIATERKGVIADEMFLFSAINLVNHARTITRLGYKVAVAKITID